MTKIDISKKSEPPNGTRRKRKKGGGGRKGGREGGKRRTRRTKRFSGRVNLEGSRGLPDFLWIKLCGETRKGGNMINTWKPPPNRGRGEQFFAKLIPVSSGIFLSRERREEGVVLVIAVDSGCEILRVEMRR